MTRGLEILQAVKKYLRIDEKVAFFSSVISKKFLLAYLSKVCDPYTLDSTKVMKLLCRYFWMERVFT